MLKEEKKIEGEREAHQVKHKVQLNPAAATSPPASALSSPSHEFSFTISLHPPAAKESDEKRRTYPPPPLAAAIDLSPADEIFFHGHLLPLHLLSHLPVSPRSSTNSLDSFTLPIKELLHSHDDESIDAVNDGGDNHHNRRGGEHESRHVLEGKERGKSKSFSIFPKFRKGGEDGDDQIKQKRKSKFDLIKRYVRFIVPFLSPRKRRPGNADEFVRQQPYSYSGNIRVKNKKNFIRGRRGEFSAPVSMKTSPANSGLLVASGAATPTGKSDSTMEELQAAVQAAIAHCKKSSAAEDKIKLPL